MRIIFKPTSPRSVIRWAEYALTALGAAALSYCLFMISTAWLYQNSQASRFDRARESQRLQVKTFRPGEVDGGGHVATASQGAVLGRLRIPRLGVSTMVVEGVDERDLHRAVGHIPGTAAPGESGNVAIAGHRDSFFRPLREIRPKDGIQLITMQGTYNYNVVSTKIVNPGDVEVLDPTKEDTLTLVTCYPFYFVGSAPKRFIVSATKSLSN